MLGVVPTKKYLAMRPRVFDRPEACRKVGSVLQGLELRLRIRIVIRDVRPAVSFGDVKIDEQLRDGFGAHAGAAIGMQSERAWHDILFIGGIGDQLLGELRGFPVSDQYAVDGGINIWQQSSDS